VNNYGEFLDALGILPERLGITRDGTEYDVTEQKNQGGKQSIPGREKGGPTTQMIDEEMPVDADIDAVMGDEELDEAMGIAHSSSKQVAGDHLPGKDFAKGRHKRMGSVNNPQNESAQKKIDALIGDNKKFAKKINESKKYKATVDKLLESYKTALGKYRTQLNEMAIFNTNLANVNNLLVNESLALTQEDKVKIINEFKGVASIGDSKKKYDGVLTEMKSSKKTITESIEAKVTDSVASSSKQKLGEVEEKTAYENDAHINKIKSLIEYVERKDKKIIK
jgi:ActR/RegA family two-component response regulator